MGNALTKDISNRVSQTDDTKEEVSSLAAFIKALGTITSKDDIDQKTVLSDRNIQGIMQLLIWNDYLKRNFGFRLKEIDLLIAEKLVKSVSLDRLGRKELIELFRAMELKIEGEDKNVDQIGKRSIGLR